MSKRLCVALVFFFIMLVAGTVNAEFYEWVDEEGNVHISDKPVSQGQEEGKVKSISGGSNSSDDDESSQSRGEWFDCIQRSNRARLEASELLEQQEGWKTKPVFNSYVRQFLDGFKLTLHLDAKLPEQEVKALGCAYGYQTVKVTTETDSQNRNRCRILDVSLGAKKLEPPHCGK